MGEPSPAVSAGVGILDVLRVDLCARALLDLVPVADLVRSERVCTRWQAAVLNYLHSRTLAFKTKFDGLYPSRSQNFFRKIIVDYNQYSLVSEIMKKWGHCIIKVIMEKLDENTNMDDIASNCPYLQHVLISFKPVDVNECSVLGNANLLSAVCKLQNVTKLEVIEQSKIFQFLKCSMLNDVGLMLKEMPQLEDLTLVYCAEQTLLSEETIKTICGLVNLKRLCINGNNNAASDEFLEALARGCPELEYLELHATKTKTTVRGVAALCRRSPSAVTTLDFSKLSNCSEYDIKNMLGIIVYIPLYQELYALGCVELTVDWFYAAAHDPRGRRLALDAGVGGSAPRDGVLRPWGSAPQTDHQKELRFEIW